MANRDRHRQGLVYGPVRPSGPRDRGRIVGNLLGLLVVVVTVSVLGLAIYFFIQARGSAEVPPQATPPSAAASATPSSLAPGSPHATPSVLALASASLSPLQTPSAAPASATVMTPGPTLFVPPVMTGLGFITFGTTADAQLRVVDPKTIFAVDEQIVSRAYLSETANSSDLVVRILKLDASQPSGQLLVREEPVKPSATTAQIFFRHVRPLGPALGPGLYTVQYVRGDQILAQGSFLVQ